MYSLLNGSTVCQGRFLFCSTIWKARDIRLVISSDLNCGRVLLSLQWPFVSVISSWSLLLHFRLIEVGIFFSFHIRKGLKSTYVTAKPLLFTLQSVYILKDLKKYLKHYFSFPMEDKKQFCQLTLTSLLVKPCFLLPPSGSLSKVSSLSSAECYFSEMVSKRHLKTTLLTCGQFFKLLS